MTAGASIKQREGKTEALTGEPTGGKNGGELKKVGEETLIAESVFFFFLNIILFAWYQS